MPIAELLVEGKIDVEIINAIKSESMLPFVVQKEGTKGTLNIIASKKRKERGKDNIYYLRDRDYDFDVDVALKVPQPIEFNDNGAKKIVGWHWCRHEIENYLLEPEILSASCGASVDEVKEEIKKAAIYLRFYQASRWTIGVSKRKGMLPPPFDLSTKPKEIAKEKKDFLIIEDCSKESCLNWVRNDSKEFLSKFENALNEIEVEKRYYEYVTEFSITNCENIDWVLHMFSGKDLFTALSTWFKKIRLNHPSEARERIISWIIDNPTKSIEAINEWQRLIDLFKTI